MPNWLKHITWKAQNPTPMRQKKCIPSIGNNNNNKGRRK
jgi:hypothetical protein